MVVKVILSILSVLINIGLLGAMLWLKLFLADKEGDFKAHLLFCT